MTLIGVVVSCTFNKCEFTKQVTLEKRFQIFDRWCNAASVIPNFS